MIFYLRQFFLDILSMNLKNYLKKKGKNCMSFVVLGIQIIVWPSVILWLKQICKLKALWEIEKLTILFTSDGFKLHIMVANKKNPGRIGRIVWITRFSLCSQMFLSATIICSLKPSPIDLIFCTNNVKTLLCSSHFSILPPSPNG